VQARALALVMLAMVMLLVLCFPSVLAAAL
jgi:hypothetical protein